ncbi:CML3 [Symbiodinium natans]|uniref:CML3 protein n=1 Tax=Symbiodinium natans TaxID=878477 RepID=A0A812I460_9DINO|nr:CML3 [Symbiodinium natans]
MAHKNQPQNRRHSQLYDPSEVVDKGALQAESVLLEDTELKRAFKDVTRDGRRGVGGLYTPAGGVMDDRPKEAGSQDERMTKVAKQYKAQKKHQKSKASRLQKTEIEMEDERVRKKAAKILDNASEVEKLQFQELFNYFDADKDTSWGSIELAQRMSDVGYATSVEAASNLLYFAGVRDVDRITYEDFVNMMPKLQAFRKLLEKDFMRLFQEKDDGTGHITTKQLREVLLVLSGPDGMEEDQMADIMKKADPTREGRVNFNDMILSLFGSKPLLSYEPPKRSGDGGLLDSLMRAFGHLCGVAPAKPPPQYVGDVAPPLPDAKG